MDQDRTKQVTSIYVVSTHELARDSRYKIGKHTGNITKLLARYKTALINPILYGFYSAKDADTMEKLVLKYLDEYRIVSNTGHKTEWVIAPLDFIREAISNIIAKNDKLNNGGQQRVADTNVHKSQSPNDKQCKLCGKIFRTPANLRTHMTRKSPCLVFEVTARGRQDNCCVYCNRVFVQRSSLTRHNRICKIKDNPYILDQNTKYEQRIRILGEQNRQLVNKIEEVQQDIDQIRIEVENKIKNATTTIPNTVSSITSHAP